MLATLNMRYRHDILSWAKHFIEPYSDTILLEVHMQPESMPSTVLAIGEPMLLQKLPDMYPDVKTFTKDVTVDKGLVRDWPSSKLGARAESPAVLHGILTRQIMDNCLGSQVCTKLLFTCRLSWLCCPV